MQNGIKDVNDFFHFYKKAVWEKDINGVINLYDDNVLIFDMWDVGFSRGLKEWTSIITQWLTSLKDERVNVIFEMIEIQQGEDTAFASSLIQFQAISTDNSVIRSMKNRISLGFIKTDGFWKVKHQHTSAPVDPNLKAILDI